MKVPAHLRAAERQPPLVAGRAGWPEKTSGWWEELHRGERGGNEGKEKLYREVNNSKKKSKTLAREGPRKEWHTGNVLGGTQHWPLASGG
jgi:hypothetical protein